NGFDSLYPKYPGGRPKSCNLPERREIKETVKSTSVEHGLPFRPETQTRRVPGRRGGVDDISHEYLRGLLREEGVSF
ncbi:MAG: IS630 family transposase, partial [Comamonadaceae bacterium]